MAIAKENGLVDIRIPAGWTLAGLVGGLVLGIVLGRVGMLEDVATLAAPVGTIWLNALQMTIIPLVAALLVNGVVAMGQAARGGRAGRQTVLWIAGILILSALLACVLMPLILEAFPIPEGAGTFLMRGAGAEATEVPKVADFLVSLIASNVVAAAASAAMLPLTIFFVLFGLAVLRLPETQRATLVAFFGALANVMLIMVGWVLKVAPIGVFALAIGVASAGGGGGGAFATLAHYIVTVSILGFVVMVFAYLIAWLFGRVGLLSFGRAIIPAQVVAISTQSSLASLPAMLVSARRLGVRDETAEFVLPLSVAMLRSTGPAMNVAVAIYVAHLAGIELGLLALVSALIIAPVISLGSVSLPGSISFVISIGPIALAMGVPIEPLALLVAVEMLPDIMRTVGNVTMDVAVTTAVDRSRDLGEEPVQP